MTKDDIIERLMLDVAVLVEELESELYENDKLSDSALECKEFLYTLQEADYKLYPEYDKQTPEEKQRVIELLKMNP